MRFPLSRAAIAALCAVISACSGEVLDAGQSDAAAPETTSPVAARGEGLTPAQAGLARWSRVVGLPIVPVSAANLPDGKVLLWSAEDKFGFANDTGRTYTVTYDPAAGSATERLVTETGHDMFCPGTANLPDGRVLVNGGLSSGKTSIFNPATGAWTSAGDMNIPRAYQGTTPLADGSVFTLGGSWAGGVGNKHGEVWTEGTGWRRLSGVLIDPFLSVDATRNFGMDSHLWLLPTGNGRVFHAGPGFNMNWIDTDGNGRVTAAIRRGDDEFSINGSAVMYDVGRILKVGGAAGYDGITSNSNSYVIELGADVTVRKVQSMAYRRAFHNSVVLPNGQVIVIGGATVAVGFSDNNAVLAPELFDPVTETFVALPPMNVPRNYHSIALLLPDGRVLSAGGGLCGNNCAANHADLQVLSPPYLFNLDGSAATRPVIQTAPSQANHGTAMAITTNGPVAGFALVRSSSTTHALNNDQRRLPLSFRANGTNSYNVDVPSNPGWALPGMYMLFALDGNGVPSVARIVRVGATAPLRLTKVDDKSNTRGAAVALALQATSPSNAILTYGASGLPAGLTLEPATGVIQGSVNEPGRFLVEVSASDGSQTVSTQFTWTVSEPGVTRFVLFEARSELNNNAWTSAAELNLLDENGQALARGAWTVTADSAEAGTEAAKAIDGNPTTFWHTQSQAANPVPPHWLKVDLGGAFQVTGFRYLPRQDGRTNGNVAQYRVFLSADGANWGNAVSEGNLTPLAATAAEKTVYFDNLARGKTAVQSSTYESAFAARAVDGNRDGVYGAGSVTHTNSEANAWWEVDLGASHQLFAVRLWNRADCCLERLANFYVLTSDTPMTGRTLAQLLADSSVTRVQTSGAAPATQLLSLAPRARYLRVQLAGTNYLQLAEVEVHGRLALNRAPTLAQPAPAKVVVGAQALLTLQASDPDGDALVYSALGLPAGLSINATSGVISGTTTQTGSYTVQASVSDGRGGNASTTFNWFVGMQPPVVAPVSVPIPCGSGTATYTASATGSGPFEYQWSFGDGTGDSGFSSEPSISHTYAAPGVYTVTLTVRNSEGGATSRQFLQAVSGVSTLGRPLASSNMLLEPRAGTSARLWVINLDNDSVSVFDTGDNSKVREIAVGSQPRSLALGPDGRVWVANKGSSNLSILDPVTLTLAERVSLPRAAMPFGVLVAADGSVFVALEGLGSVLKLSSAGAIMASLDVGSNPRHLALTAAGERLLVSRFITPFQPGEGTASVQTTLNGVKQGAEVVIVDPSTMTVTRTITLQHSDKPDTTVSGRGVPNYLGAAAISPDGLSAWVPSKQDNIQRGSLRDGRNIDFQNTVRAISSRIDLANEVEDYGARVDHDNSSVASAAVYHPRGVYLFVTLETSRQIAVLDAYGKREIFRVDAGRAPQAVTVAEDGRTLYVHNFMDRTVGVYDLGPLLDQGEPVLPLRTTLASVGSERLTSQVLRGKQLFYDARDTRLARDSYMSCATCHNDAGHDGRTWDLTGMGEGLRNTISLRGRAGGQGRLHWSANFDEVQDFEGQIRALAQGTGLMTDAQFATGTRNQTLGDPKAGVSADLDALAAYLVSRSTFDPSPYRTPTGTLTAEAALGKAVFANQCVSCHSGNSFTDSASLSTRKVGTIKPSSGARLAGTLAGLDTPTLRDVWSTAPYLHDGSAASIEAAIQAHTNLSLSAAELANVSAFTRQIGSEEPAPPVVAVTGTGLTAQYFTNNSLTGNPLFSRVEAVNFDWGNAAPAVGVPADNFSIRWTGKVIATTTGSHRFQTVSDDGVRLWVNGGLVIDNWTAHSPTTNTSGNISFVAGQRYDLKLEYQERTVGATIQLLWQQPLAASFSVMTTAQLVPAGVGLTGHYFANNALTGAPVLTRIEGINFDWGTTAPGTGVPAENYSTRWTGQLLAPATGSYRLQTVSDDGVRVWINGTLVINNWTLHAPTTDTTPVLSLLADQRYDITVEYNELTGGALMQFLWLTPGAANYVTVPVTQLHPTGVGLRGQYFANNALSGTPVLTRTEAVGFDWGLAAPAAGVPADNFSARWQGQISAPASGPYRFLTVSDDGVRLWVNGALVIDNWTLHAPTSDVSSAIPLVAGQRYDLKLEYNELTGPATIQLHWLTPVAAGYVPVPGNQLHGL